LNIERPPPPAPGSSRRGRLVEALLEELLSWNPREFIVAFRRWHRGSFSLVHLNVLTILEMDGSVSMSHLAEALGVSVASTTGIVDRMEKRELVERRHDGADRRIVLVHPTETGRDVFREIDRRRRDGLERMLAQLGDKELAGLLEGHRALRTARAGLVTGLAKDVAETAGSGASHSATPSGVHRVSTTSPDDQPVTPTRRGRA
jgi:DNA-binding MarR family transcriptional regulator